MGKICLDDMTLHCKVNSVAEPWELIMSAMPTRDVLWPNLVLVGSQPVANGSAGERGGRQTLEPEERLLALLERKEGVKGDMVSEER